MWPLQYSQEEKDFEAHFVQTHQQYSEGKYVVVLAVRTTFQSRPMVVYNGYQQLHRQRDVIKVVANLDYEEAHRHLFLPHHPAIKASSTSTKVRSV